MRYRHSTRNNQRGQTLIIALLILGVLLILGAVFAGILSRTIRSASVSRTRSLNNDFALAGIRYAHSQLVNSDLGADWRGNMTAMVLTGNGTTRDPDAFYLRGPASVQNGLVFPGTTRFDQGGPDGFGPFFRIDYRGGRALVRVRYAPGDPSIFSAAAPGAVRDLGMMRNYIIIESIGRQGEVIANDPTQSQNRGNVQVGNYGSQAAFEAAFARLKEFDEKEITSRKLMALAQIGLIDYARYVTNKYKSTRPVELGIPTQLGSVYRETANTVGSRVTFPLEVGSTQTLYNVNNTVAGAFPGGGSTRVNGDVRVHGQLVMNLNQSLGDAFLVSGAIGGDDNNSALLVNRTRKDTGTGSFATDPIQSLIANSSSSSFTTYDGVFRDGTQGFDANNNPRGVSYLAPPTIQGAMDSVEGSIVSRYVKNTRDSGVLSTSGNTGAHGHGSGVYVDNLSDFQVPDDDRGRRSVGGAASLVQDWLNPFGEGVSFRSGWHGPFYIPVGAFLHLTSDGFLISRNVHPDQNPNERTWKSATGADSGLSAIRYRVGYGTDGQTHVVNTLTAGMSGNVNGALSPADYDRGPVFNGTLYFEGNVRVRGVIPTDLQMTVVSNKSIYIEGNIVKGVESNDLTSGVTVANDRITRPSKSQLMLMAKDYVTLNPTMFFGPASETNAQVEKGGQGVGGYNPLKLGAPDGAVTLQFDSPLGDYVSGNPAYPITNPSVKLPEYTQYYEMDRGAPTNPLGTGNRLAPTLLVTQALEYTNPGPSNTFISMNVNRGGVGALANSDYQFPTLISNTNSAKYIWASINGPGGAPAFGPVYGLGTESFQQAPKFETSGFALFDPNTATASYATRSISSSFYNNSFSLRMMDTNAIQIGLTQFGNQPSGNYMLGRSVVTPSNVKIEASIYAEEGSFFVIPGDWFNPNPNDRRDRYEARVIQLVNVNGLSIVQARAQAANERLTEFGSSANTPFYGEPADVKIDIVGSVSENMPPPMSQQAEWLKKWGWIPTKAPSAYDFTSGELRNIPYSHLSPLTRTLFAANPNGTFWTPNISITYDPNLATGRVNGYGADTSILASDPNNANTYIRSEVNNGVFRALPPMPRLPVSPSLAYFGEITR